jgi:hypothetical protein
MKKFIAILGSGAILAGSMIFTNVHKASGDFYVEKNAKNRFLARGCKSSDGKTCVIKSNPPITIAL